jgi:hypothetical protein
MERLPTSQNLDALFGVPTPENINLANFVEDLLSKVRCIVGWNRICAGRTSDERSPS